MAIYKSVPNEICVVIIVYIKDVVVVDIKIVGKTSIKQNHIANHAHFN